MAVRTIRPRVQNGTVVRRSTPARKTSARKQAPKTSGRVAGRAKGSRQARRKASGGSRVFWLLILVASVMASGFIYSLRSQVAMHRLGQMESNLRGELEDIANRQRYEVMEQQRAINPQQSESAARQSGLVQPRLAGPPLKPAVESVNRQGKTAGRRERRR
ncbi:MAG: hypothetical protein IPM66_20600 [Acidobacteriota bacterium]|nr:MAG: hypothetical protein IPM66_20600 [Acidobacteriota bacterium]